MQLLNAQKNTFILSDKLESRIMLSKELEVYVDSSGKMSFEQILHDSSLHFSSASSIGKPKKYIYWVRINLKSKSSKDVTYRIAAVWWDYVTAYLISPDSTVQILQTGLLRKKSDLKENDFATFQLPVGKEIKLYARLSASGYFMRMENVNILLSKHVPALENERYYLFMMAMLFGIMIGFAIYNLSISVSTRDGSYIWYFLYITCLAISLIGQLGSHTSYLVQFILPEHPLIGLFLKRIVDPVAFISLILFSRSFLHTRKKHPRWDYFLLFMIFAMTLHSILWLMGAYNRANSPYIAIIFYLASVIAIIITGVIAYREGFKAARFFIAGLIMTAMGILISLFNVSGWGDLLWFLPDSRFFNFVKESGVFFFGGIDAFIFSLALADRQKIRLEKLVAERTVELNHSLDTLQQTQKQLIQSEKMASLGELTAGIAHEIQNPLNFVNNFSEVNTELIDEAGEEINKGNIDEVKIILNDLKENEKKINHHGKRAGAIVKGMLQHSQSSTGKKEPTDINALCDEYLRLSYNGLRAKDKSFNAEMKTNFDSSIGKINIIPQDIGRVLLNLYNNAFYAVNEKGTNSLLTTHNSQFTTNYQPTVSVTTKKSEDHVTITVSDNGNGIPQKIVDKIFQPFFTTKPTGQGTGLGLSLSYDIIKAHGGELKVESRENQGTTFIIQLLNHSS
jgi:signal transduction histidine kinase